MKKSKLVEVMLVMVEKRAAVLMGAGVVDRVLCARAGRVIGGDGVPSIAAFGIETLRAAPDFIRTGVESCGEDVVETWARKA